MFVTSPVLYPISNSATAWPFVRVIPLLVASATRVLYKPAISVLKLSSACCAVIVSVGRIGWFALTPVL